MHAQLRTGRNAKLIVVAEVASNASVCTQYWCSTVTRCMLVILSSCGCRITCCKPRNGADLNITWYLTACAPPGLADTDLQPPHFCTAPQAPKQVLVHSCKLYRLTMYCLNSLLAEDVKELHAVHLLPLSSPYKVFMAAARPTAFMLRHSRPLGS